MTALSDDFAMLPRPAPPCDLMQLFGPIASAPSEIAVFAYFDPEWRLLGLRHVPSAERDTVTIPLRDIVGDALAFGAVAVAMAHNHPSGDPTPSTADHTLTRRLARTLAPLGVRLVEHLILAAGGSSSFRRQGLL